MGCENETCGKYRTTSSRLTKRRSGLLGSRVSRSSCTCISRAVTFPIGYRMISHVVLGPKSRTFTSCGETFLARKPMWSKIFMPTAYSISIPIWHGSSHISKVSDCRKRTIIVVGGDNGEAFFEHGFAAHASALYNEVVKVPLIIYGPGLSPGVDDRPAQTSRYPSNNLGHTRPASTSKLSGNHALEP